MGYPSGTFTSPNSGKLQITFSGVFGSWSGGGSPAWFGGNSGAFLRILCTAGTRTSVITLESPSNIIEMDYTAGSSVACSMSLIGWSASGIGGVQATNLTIRCILMKR